ncbi:MAG TPA: 2-oxoacid:ferredoxin oxidoreductase subunit beta [Syntrophales bacterium]|nr:2-oxoacid:ferredoxin oxidoreductase subunit beta [Syntrophales bacterium]HOL58961.1 2-oxoacid:ferredoxin oxidoreductase subunit beta [Syntrophales bacterium]HPO34761.1 2-oxoacid:ferredoxin oxidoreductase subunit beta [Syntrophales bacterium]
MTARKKELPPHPMDHLLRVDRIPHIWCPGCGIGTVFGGILAAIQKSAFDLDRLAMVSGIGCTGRMAGYIKVDSFHTTHGRAIPFATGLKLARPDIKVIVASGDGDLFAIGGNHFIHAARRNIDMTVICVNNLNYGMTGGQQAPSTPLGFKTTTTPEGSPEEPFNFCHLADTCGAVYVARWTALHIRLLTNSIAEAMQKRGFSFVEVLCPCPSAFGRRNRLGSALDTLKLYHDRSVIKNDIDTKGAVIDFSGEIVVGKFVDRTRQTFLDYYQTIVCHKESEENSAEATK